MSICLSAMSVCLFNSLPSGEYSNYLVVAAFSNKPFSSKTSSPVKYSYLPTFPEDKARISPVYLSP